MIDNVSSMNPLLSSWLAQLQASLQRLPSTPRLAVLWDGQEVGSVEAAGFAAFADRVDVSNLVRLVPATSQLMPAWQLLGSPSVALNQLAEAMRQHSYAQVAGLWRSEQLAVCKRSGDPVATVERGAVRALGISTHGVHLHGHTADRRVWIQQRALDKQTHPGRWDTLMGGMVCAAETLEQALARETEEEAGLALRQLGSLHHAGQFTMHSPNASDNGLEYVVERIDWFECVVPDDVRPVNTDGEVQQFGLTTSNELERMLLDGAFTPEAGLILGKWLLASKIDRKSQ